MKLKKEEEKQIKKSNKKNIIQSQTTSYNTKVYTTSSKRRNVNNLDLSTYEGYELLSNQEKELCLELELIPQHYIMIKERLIKESYARGFLQPNQAKQLITIDVQKTQKIFDFFVSLGWLVCKPSHKISINQENHTSSNTLMDTTK